MATYLETYRTKKLAYEDLLSHGRSLDGKDLCFCLEAIYRVQVLETLSLLERTCPTGQNDSAFALHARLVAGILGGLLVPNLQGRKNSKRASGCLSVLLYLFQ